MKRLILLVVLNLVSGLWACNSDTMTNGDLESDEGVVDVSYTDANQDDAATVSDLGMDVGDATESSDLADTEDSADMEVDAECICADPLATCSPISNRCLRTDIQCGSGDSCPDGYSCVIPPPGFEGESFCRCDGPYSECGPFCDDGQCRNGWVCVHNPELNLNVCRGIQRCQDDYQCGPESICFQRPPREDGRPGNRVCRPTGDKEFGESCDHRIECKTGVCDEGVCQVACQVNTDCDDGEVCQQFARPNRGLTGCVAGECDADECDPSISQCRTHSNGYTNCVGRACQTTEDCPTGDCVIMVGTNRRGLCTDKESPEEPGDCKPGEFKAWEDDPYCRLPGPCWTGEGADSTCPGPYECLKPDFAFAGQSIMEFCSRLIE